MKKKKYTVEQRLKKLERSVGELYLFLRIVMKEVQEENNQEVEENS